MRNMTEKWSTKVKERWKENCCGERKRSILREQPPNWRKSKAKQQKSPVKVQSKVSQQWQNISTSSSAEGPVFLTTPSGQNEGEIDRRCRTQTSQTDTRWLSSLCERRPEEGHGSEQRTVNGLRSLCGVKFWQQTGRKQTSGFGEESVSAEGF